MEILRAGQLPSEKMYVGECDSCRSLVRFKAGEAKHESWRNEQHATVKCPTPGCAATITVDTTNYEARNGGQRA